MHINITDGSLESQIQNEKMLDLMVTCRKRMCWNKSIFNINNHGICLWNKGIEILVVEF